MLSSLGVPGGIRTPVTAVKEKWRKVGCILLVLSRIRCGPWRSRLPLISWPSLSGIYVMKGFCSSNQHYLENLPGGVYTFKIKWAPNATDVTILPPEIHFSEASFPVLRPTLVFLWFETKECLC